VSWYFVPEDSLDLNTPTYFQSKNWFDHALGETTVLGEVDGAERVYSKGELPAGIVLTGKPCGSARQFAGADPATIVPLFMGFPQCCLTPGFEVINLHAGLVVSGTIIGPEILLSAALAIVGESDLAVELGAVLAVVGESDLAVELGAGLAVVGESDLAVELGAGLAVVGESDLAVELGAGLAIAVAPPTPISLECGVAVSAIVAIGVELGAVLAVVGESDLAVELGAGMAVVGESDLAVAIEGAIGFQADNDEPPPP